MTTTLLNLPNELLDEIFSWKYEPYHPKHHRIPINNVKNLCLTGSELNKRICQRKSFWTYQWKHRLVIPLLEKYDIYDLIIVLRLAGTSESNQKFFVNISYLQFIFINKQKIYRSYPEIIEFMLINERF